MEPEQSIAGGSSTRRSFLAAAGVGTTAAFAGCTGNGNGNGNGNGSDADEGTIRMRTATEGTTAYAANEGISAVINDHSDDLFVEAQPSPGTEANIGALMDQDVEMAYVQNWSSNQIMDGEEPFHEVDFQPAQVFHFYTLPWFFATANDDIQELTDVDADTEVSPTPQGSGTAPALEHALSFAADDYDRVSYDYGEQASAMEEGRLDIGVGTYMNLEIEPGWLQEMGGTVDLTIPEVPDDVFGEWEDDTGLATTTFDGGELDAVSGSPGDVRTVIFEYNFIARADLDYDLVYDFLDELYGNRDELGDYHAVLELLEDGENMTEPLFDDVPLHAAAYDFFDEQDLLEEQYERADEA